MRTRRWVFGSILAAVAISLGVFMALRLMQRAPAHARLETLLSDLERARAEAGVSPQWYAYRLHHYCEDAFLKKDWLSIKGDLLKQGFRVRNEFSDSSDLVFPASAAFRFAAGPALVPSARLYFTPKKSGLEPTRYPIHSAGGYLELKDEVPLSQIRHWALAKGSFLGKALEAAGSDSKLLFVKNLKLTYSFTTPIFLSGGTGSPTSSLEVELELCDEREDQRRHFAYSATSDLEPQAKRVLKWLPFTTMQSSDRSGKMMGGPSAGSTPNNTFLYLASRRNDEERFDPREFTAYTDPDLKVAAESIDTMIIEAEGRKLTYGLLGRFKKLRELMYFEGPPRDGEAISLAVPASIEKLQLSKLTSKGIRRLAALPKLRELTLDATGLSSDDLRLLTSMHGLESLHFWGQLTVDDRLMAALAKMPRLKDLGIGGVSKFSVKGLRELTGKGQLTGLSIGLKGLPPEASAAVCDLPNLEDLSLDEATLSEDTVRRLGQMKKLRYLILTYVRGMTPKNLLHLAPLRNLDVIQLSDCPGATLSGILALKRLLPGKYRAP